MSETGTLSDAWQLLDAARKILIVTHVRPDGDATGSSFGLAAFLRSLRKSADVLYPAAVPAACRGIVTNHLTDFTPAECRNYDLAVILDCAAPSRINCGEKISQEELLSCMKTLLIDHHQANSVEATWKVVDERAAATSLLLFELAKLSGKAILKEAAECWMLGLNTDTGSFRFSNSDARTFRAAAELLDCGADQPAIVNALYFSKPRSQQLFESEVIRDCIRLEAAGKLAAARLPQSLFDRYCFDMRDGENLIDLLREIEGSVISLLYYQKGADVKCSLRSKDPAFPVGELARKFGGGGHAMAAGITLSGKQAETAGPELEKFIAGWLQGEYSL